MSVHIQYNCTLPHAAWQHAQLLTQRCHASGKGIVQLVTDPATNVRRGLDPCLEESGKFDCLLEQKQQALTGYRPCTPQGPGRQHAQAPKPKHRAQVKDCSEWLIATACTFKGTRTAGKPDS